ncbi:MAG: apolipoprotein N-acyltransferase [Acidobacteriota bacterium]
MAGAADLPRRLRFDARLGGALLSGGLAQQAFPLVDLGFLAWVALVPLLAALRNVSPSRGMRLGLAQGMIFYTGLLYWIPNVMATYGGLPWSVSLGVWAVLVLVLSLFHAAFGATQAWLFARLGDGALLAAPAAWVLLAEWLRVWPLGGFPWGFLGYTQHAAANIRQLAALGGVYGLSFVIVAVNAAFVGAVPLPGRHGRSRRGWMAAATALLVLLAAWTGGGVLRRSIPPGADPIPVAAIQGNVRQDEKWLAANRGAIERRELDLTQQVAEEARLVLWPESSTPENLEESPLLRMRLQEIARDSSVSFLIGSVHRLPAGGYTNSAFLVTPDGGLDGRYDKIHLVPFGEKVPLGRLLFFARPLVKAVGRFVPGDDPSPLGGDLHLGGEDRPPTPFGVAICYEITYPTLVAKQVREGATFLTTITNDAWFGRSAAPEQHFAMAVLRAVESRRWLIRAANTGISGIISPTGQVVTRTPLFETALVEGTIRARRDLSLAARHPQAVPKGCVILLAIAVSAAAARGRRVDA